MTRTRASSSDNRLWWMLGGGTFLFLVIVLIVIKKPSWQQPLEQVTIPAQALPTWQGEQLQKPEPASSVPEVLTVYLDVSHPMGGFLPFPLDSSVSNFREFIQVVPGHLFAKFGGSDVKIRWVGVAQDRRDLSRGLQDGQHDTPRIERMMFDGNETRLPIAIGEILEDLRSGRTRAAALITDLLATGELTGAMGAAKPLADLMDSKEMRSGAYDLGLLGVRAKYWGVTTANSTACPKAISGVGCWYSERLPGYKQLTEVAQAPLYVVLVGIGGGAVAEVGEAIRAAAEELELESQWELLTEASKPVDTLSLICDAHKPEQPTTTKQFALFWEEDTRLFRCGREEDVVLTCAFSDPKFEPKSVDSNWPDVVGVSLKEGKIVATIQCGSLQNPRRFPKEHLRLEVIAQRQRDASNWENWSSESDEREENLKKTLQLELFVETVKLQPDEYFIDLEPVLRVPSHGN